MFPLILFEGLLFLLAFRQKRFPFLPWPPYEYVMWRLETAYGSFNHKARRPKTFQELLKEAWKDREGIARFLLWRRKLLPRRP